MKKLLLAFCLYFIALGVSMAQILDGDIRLSTQSDVNKFNYTEVKGSITINGNTSSTGGDTITDLSPLSKLTKVGGNFQIASTKEKNLNDLANLKEVVGDLRILANENMQNITLPGLKSVGSLSITSQSITSTHTLTEINLPALTIITIGGFGVSFNRALKTLNAPYLSKVVGAVSIQGNISLTSLNLPITSITGGINLTGNTALNDCCTFKNLLRLKVSDWVYFSLNGNGPNCRSKEDLTKACPTPPPPPNNALTFDGADDVVEVGSPDFYKNTFTIEGWLKPQKGAIFNIYQGDNSAIYAEISSSKSIRVIVRNSPANFGGLEFTGAKDIVTDGQWHHFAIVKDNDDYVSLYIDGMPDGKSADKIADFSTTVYQMRLGMNVKDNARCYQGSMDEIRCWNINRVQVDIQKNMSKPLTGTEAGMVVYYSFDQGSANGDNKKEAILRGETRRFNGTLVNFGLSGTTSNFTTGAPVQ